MLPVKNTKTIEKITYIMPNVSKPFLANITVGTIIIDTPKIKTDITNAIVKNSGLRLCIQKNISFIFCFIVYRTLILKDASLPFLFPSTIKDTQDRL